MTDYPNEVPDEEDEMFFEADPELDAAINEDSDDWCGKYDLDELLEGESDDKEA